MIIIRRRRPANDLIAVLQEIRDRLPSPPTKPDEFISESLVASHSDRGEPETPDAMLNVVGDFENQLSGIG